MSAPAGIDDTPDSQSRLPVPTMRSTVLLACVLYTLLTVTWAIGRIEPLHSDAYRDIALNVTTTYIGVLGLILGSVGRRRDREVALADVD